MSKIIIIEDDNLLNNTLQFNLKMEGYEVFSCYSVSDAEKHITTSCADLLIMDVNLGDGNGFELLKKIQRLLEDSLHLPDCKRHGKRYVKRL